MGVVTATAAGPGVRVAGAAAPAGGGQAAGGVGLAGEVGAPEQDQLGVGGHVVHSVDLGHPGEGEAEAAQAPADDARVPPLRAGQVREAGGELPTQAIDEHAVPGPHRGAPWSSGAHRGGDAVQRLVPGGVAPGVGRAPVAHAGMEQAARVVDDLGRGLTAHAQEAAAVRVLRVAAHGHHAVAGDLHQHAAVGGVAVHGAHGAHDATLGGGHGGAPPAELPRSYHSAGPAGRHGLLGARRAQCR